MSEFQASLDMTSAGTLQSNFEVEPGLLLRADIHGPETGRPILLLHGGGQTRASWSHTGESLGDLGYRAISLDLRGHGESGWSPGRYRLDSFAEDVRRVAEEVGPAPVLVGASLGGMAALLACGEDPRLACSALVLVDIAPRIDPQGGRGVQGFMAGTASGFDTLEEAADAVATYLPHRERPSDNRGLMKNLRTGEDGRLYWRWDPDFIAPQKEGWDFAKIQRRLEDAVRAVEAPVLMVRGGLSEIVSEEAAKEIAALSPRVELAVVPSARHMVAGDDNDAFRAALLAFLSRHAPAH